MDLSHIPLRGFPQPNLLVVPDLRREAVGRWLGRLALASGGVFAVCFAVFAVVVFTPRGVLPAMPAPWPFVMACGLMAGLFLTPGLVWAARKVNQQCSPLVIPGRLTEYPGDPAGCLWGCLVTLLTLPLSLPLAIAWGVYTRGFIDIGVEYVDRYALRVAPLRVPKHLLSLVQQGQVVWFVPRAWNRAATLWSEQQGYGSPYCLVNQAVLDWFEKAAAKAHETEHRAYDRKDRVRALRKLRKKRGRYARGHG